MHTDALLRLSRRLHAASDLTAVIDEVIAVVAAETRYAHAWLLVLTGDGDGVEIVGNPATGDARVHERIATLAVSADRALQRCFEATEPFVVEDMRLDPLADQAQVAFFGNRTVVGVPMVRLAERLGAFHVGTFGDEEGVLLPTPAELAFVVQIASVVSVVVGRLRAEEAKRAIEEKMRANQRLEALGQLAGEVAHDFNNMLVSIVGNSDLLARALVGHPALELVEEVQDAARRAATLTRQLLAFSRGQLLDRRDLDLGDVVRDLSRLLLRLLPDDVELVVLPTSAPHVVHADRGQLDQVIMNLAINARDAMPDGGRLVVEVDAVDLDAAFVVAHPGAREGRFVVLRVSDSGVGMSAEVRGRIFEPFFTTKPASVGTGLGLAVVDSVLQQHTGFALVHSQPGAGTSFELYLPQVEAALATRARAPTALAAAHGRGERVLVVDDDAHILTFIDRLLTGAGYRVIRAANGARALELLDAHPDVSLVLTDLVMPVMSGPALIDAAMMRPDPPRFLVMTGYARGALAEASFDFALTKPFSSEDLLAKVREALDAPRPRRSSREAHAVGA